MTRPRPHRSARPLLAAASALLLAGCDGLVGPGRTCSAIALPALIVDVRDAATDAPLGPGARVVARAGRFADTLHVPADADQPGPYGLAYERAGVYTVTVEAPGYRPWSREGIRVGADGCHVETVSVVARLER